MTQLVQPITIIAASFCIQSPFLKTEDTNVTEKRKDVLSDDGDPFTLFATFIEWLKVKDEHHSASRAWCKKMMIEEQRMYEMTKLLNQFSSIMRGINGEYADEYEPGEKRALKLVIPKCNEFTSSIQKIAKG
jgi:hypothetical protein